MKAVKKVTALLLAVVIVLAAFPAVNALALPKRFDVSRVKKIPAAKDVYLEINDMRFKGKLTNGNISDDVLQELVDQTLRELGISDYYIDIYYEAIDKMLADAQLSPERMQKLRSDLYDMAGVVPGVSLIASVLKTVDGMISGVPASETSENLMELGMEASAQVAESLGGSVKEAMGGGAISVGGAVVGWADALKTMYDRLQQDSDRWDNLKNGKDSLRNLSTFYEQLDKKINDYLGSHQQWQIVFKDAKGLGVYTLFGVSGIETWTLNMTLSLNSPVSGGGWAGTYTGIYEINADYDMASWQRQVDNAVRSMGQMGEMIRRVESEAQRPMMLFPSSTGTCQASRRLMGSAKVTVGTAGSGLGIEGLEGYVPIRIDFNKPMTDDKNVNIGGITVKGDETVISTGYGAFANMGMSFDISADKDNFTVVWHGVDVSFFLPEDGWSIDQSLLNSLRNNTSTEKLAWDGDFWKRGNNLSGDIYFQEAGK